MTSLSLLLLLLLLVLLSHAGSLIAGAQCDQSQASALLQLKKGLNFSSASSALLSWRSGTNCCLWDGVTCEEFSGRVTAIDLSNRSIAGSITGALFNITSLESLNLAYNLFDPGPLPPSGFEKLGNLTYLNLSNAGFVGQVPAGISRLRKLVTLDLSTFVVNQNPSSSLKLESPDLRALVGGLFSLKDLYLDGVNISKNGTGWCGALSDSVPQLQVLSLTGCLLSGPIDESLSKLRNLSVIQLNQNNLSSLVPEFFGNFSSLSVLHLSSSELRGFFPKSVFQLRKLKDLDLSTNPMLSGCLTEFPKENALESLVLSSTNFSGSLPESLGNLGSLMRLELMDCQFSGLMPPSIGNLSQLVHLDLSLNSFTGPIPPMVGGERISAIILAHNNLTGPIPVSLGNGRLRNLKKIHLWNNSLTGSIPVSLFSLPALQELQLNLNKLSGQLKEFSNASPLLNIVYLSSNRLQGEIPKSFFELSGLEILALASNNFSGAVELDLIGKLKNLSILDLSNNRLSVLHTTGDSSHLFPSIATLKLVSCNLTMIPGFLRNRDQMSVLDVSNNRISGTIPKWIWSIGTYTLSYLNLSHNLFMDVEGPIPNNPMGASMIIDLRSNRLRGLIPLPPQNNIIVDYSNNFFASSIPSNISNYLNYTIFFSLSNNNLTGEVPPSICDALFLQILDLSDNQLSGLIPKCLMESSTELRVLNLRGNQFQGTLPGNISPGCALQTINLNGNKLEGNIPRSLTNCGMLEVLDLGNNWMLGPFPYWLGYISTLRVLVLRSNRFYGQVGHPPGISEGNYTFSKLQIFDISSNNFTGSLPAECFNNMKAMMTEPGTAHLTVGVKYLQFDANYYQDSVTIVSKGLEMTLVKILTIFTSIDFSCNSFEGSLPAVIGELKSLYVLNMSKNALTGAIPLVLGNLMELESLDLSDNRLSGEIPPSLTSLTFLAFLNLSNNNLVGRIPESSQFSTFSNSSFQGNAGLCGSALLRECANSSVAPATYLASKSYINPDWQSIFVGIGVGAGLAVAFGPLLLWESWRKWYFGRVDSLFWAIVSVCLVCDNCGDMKIEAEENMGDMEVEEELDRKFCVFCTELEFLQDKMVIHHVKCCCHVEQ